MEIFNIIAGIASILSLLISLCVFNKVTKIEQNLTIDSSVKVGKQTGIGTGNKIAGRDVNG